MTLKNCKHCGTPIVLTPTAKERAVRYGGSPSDYTNMFTEHSACLMVLRNADVWSVEALRTLITRYPYYKLSFTSRGT